MPKATRAAIHLAIRAFIVYPLHCMARSVGRDLHLGRAILCSGRPPLLCRLVLQPHMHLSFAISLSSCSDGLLKICIPEGRQFTVKPNCG